MTYVRCAVCGALGELVLDGGRLDLALARAGTHVRETHPGASVPDSLRVVPDVAFPPADCEMMEPREVAAPARALRGSHGREL
ncbi:hypothetical protein AB0O22_34765 [Streptomyces sp. NPDC091204]|uniref:hypothetical protein n=1 Tax=Streptomyces sp. NPDC091204 TaxID=3155299 RepID=UPI00342FC7D4